MTTFTRSELPATLRDIDPAELAVLLDVDGTLAPIVEDPAAAGVPDSTLKVVRRAVERVGVLGVVTGRTLDRARAMVPIEGLWIGAVHGMHLVAPDGSSELCAAAGDARAHLDRAATLAQTVGWQYEDKGHSVTVHLRQRGAAGQALDPVHVRTQLGMVLNPLKVELHDAKQAIEVRVIGSRTKAFAVQRIVEAAPAQVRTVVFVGDDRTDLDAFRALDELAADDARGLSVCKVAVGGDGAPPELAESADVVLASQRDVEGFLNLLVGV